MAVATVSALVSGSASAKVWGPALASASESESVLGLASAQVLAQASGKELVLVSEQVSEQVSVPETDWVAGQAPALESALAQVSARARVWARRGFLLRRTVLRRRSR